MGISLGKGRKRAWGILAVAGALCVGALGCNLNLFSLVDQPQGDTQLISAARACFDRGDFACALDHYSKLSGSAVDVQVSERAFATLDQQGASMGTFLTAFTTYSSQTGAALGYLARSMMSGAGETRRLAIYDAYLTYKNVSSSSTQLAGLVRFVTATALAAELLAEAAGSDSSITQNDISLIGATCASTGSPACAVASQCDSPASTVLTNTASGDIDNSVNRPTGTPRWDYIFHAINNALAGMNSLGAGGSFSGTSGAFGSISSNGQPSGSTGAARCFRYYLLNGGLGR